MNNNEEKMSLPMETNEIISLMNVYLTDLNFREESYWKQIFVYYYSTIVVICFPAIASVFSARDIADKIPTWIFYLVGIFMSLCFFYVSLAYIARTKPLVEAYDALIKDLPDKYRRKKMSDNKHEAQTSHHNLFDYSMKTFISIVMLISQLALVILFWLVL